MKISFVSNRTQFDGDALETRGLGGSESAVINLSRSLKRLLPDSIITIYNGMRTVKEYHGIIYKSLNDFYSECKNFNQDLFISLRGPEPFTLSYIDAKCKCLWSQDDLHEKGLQWLQKNEYAKSNIDFFLAISEYAKGEIQNGFPEKKVYLQRNGYNSRLISTEKFIKYRNPIAVYTSTPYRGLDVLTECWPMIYNFCVRDGYTPELRVFTGMQLYGWSDEPFKPLYESLEKMPGVKLYGAIPQTQLYKELLECKVMCYPNHFLETGCMSVLEAIACGVWVVTTDLGALKEQVVDGYNGALIKGDAHSDYYKTDFINKSMEALCNPTLPRRNCDHLIFSWDQQARNLINIIKKESENKYK